MRPFQSLSENPAGRLSKCLQAVPAWTNPVALRQVDAMLRGDSWAPLSPQEALQLLDPRFWASVGIDGADSSGNPLDTSEQDSIDPIRLNSMLAREYAVRCLVKMPDQDLNLYMLQLSQLMKLETDLTSSPLAAFLMYRALRNPTLIGQSLYWHIRSELYNTEVFPHMAAFLRQYLDACGSAAKSELQHQEKLMGHLRNVIKHIKGERQRRKEAGEDYSVHVLKEVLHEDLAHLEFPEEGIRMPVNPNLKCKSVKVEKGKVMGSHQVPLWLVFNNMDPTAEPIEVIFKDGDDVRQDALVLQLFNIMQVGAQLRAVASPPLSLTLPRCCRQEVWEDDGIDIPLRPGTTGAYGCVSVGFEVGVVCVPPSSEPFGLLLQS